MSALGVGAELLWAGLCGAVERPSRILGEAAFGDLRKGPSIYPLGLADRILEENADVPGRCSGMIVAAVREALADAGAGPDVAARAGLAVGTTLGDIDLAETDSAGPESTFHVAAVVSAATGLGGPSHGMATACSAGVHAVAWAVEQVRTGQATAVVAAGGDGYSRVAIAALHRLGVLDPEVCRPFDVDRAGMVTGEGAAALVVESAESARERGAPALAVVEGVGLSCDAHHATAPEPDGSALTSAVAAALAGARGPVGAAVLHRAGISVNDDVEDLAVTTALGDAAPAVAAYAPKAVLGHTAGGAGALGCLAAVLMLRHRTIPPNAHVRQVAPIRAMAVPTAPARLAHERILVSGTGFGGNNAAVVLAAV